MYLDLGERDSLTSSVSEEENLDTMKTSEEVDFEKEFRPDDVGKKKKIEHPRTYKLNLFLAFSLPFCVCVCVCVMSVTLSE